MKDEKNEFKNITSSDSESCHTNLSDDIVKDYLNKIGKIPLLSAEEEQKYARLKDNGDKAARKKLIESNLRLVVSISRRYVGRGASFEDLIQIGNEGLINGIDKFNAELDYKISTYATYWIKQAITRFLANYSNGIKIPTRVAFQLKRAVKTQNEYMNENGENIDLYHAVLLMCKSGIDFTELKTLISNKGFKISDDNLVFVLEQLFRHGYIYEHDCKVDKKILDLIRDNTAKIFKSIELAMRVDRTCSLDDPICDGEACIGDFIPDDEIDVEQKTTGQETIRLVKDVLNKKYISKTVCNNYTEGEKEYVLLFGKYYNEYINALNNNSSLLVKDSIFAKLDEINNKINYIMMCHSIIDEYNHIIDICNIKLKTILFRKYNSEDNIYSLINLLKKKYSCIEPEKLLLNNNGSLISLEDEINKYINSVINILCKRNILSSKDVEDLRNMIESETISYQLVNYNRSVNDNYRFYERAYNGLRNIDIILRKLFFDSKCPLKSIGDEYLITKERARAIMSNGTNILRKNYDYIFNGVSQEDNITQKRLNKY